MDLRFALQQLAAQHKLSPDQAERLLALDDSAHEPESLARTLPFGVALLGASLAGFGVILWVASNWETLGRGGRFALLELLVVVMCAGAVLRPAARVPLSILALLGIGGLFAYFGQTYQTGADPWQLFAWWALLALPLCAGVRHDALWSCWALVTATCISLWVNAHTGHTWRAEPSDLPFHLVAWIVFLLMAFALSPAFSARTGAGIVSARVSLTLATAVVATTAVGSLVRESVALQFWLGIFVLTGAGVALAQERFHDTFALSIIGLALNVLVVGLLVETVIRGSRSSFLFWLMVIGLCAAGLLAGTVKIILSLARRHAKGGAP